MAEKETPNKKEMTDEAIIKRAKMLTNSLPAILNETDSNIEAKAEAARKAEATARRSGDAAATKALDEAKRAGQEPADVAIRAARDAANKVEADDLIYHVIPQEKKPEEKEGFSRREFIKDAALLVGGSILGTIAIALACKTSSTPTNSTQLSSTPSPTSSTTPESTSSSKPTTTPTFSPATTPSSVPISVLSTSACAITSPPPSMEGINTHTELYGTGADPDIITLGPKVGGHPGWPTYEHKPGMSFEAYNRGSPVLAPFDMVLVGFRDTSNSYQIVSGGPFVHADDVKLFFESASPDWPGVYMTVYHLLTSPLLTGHTQSSSNDLAAPPAEGYQLFWDGNYTLSPTGNAASYGALIGYKVKRGELIGFAGTVPTPDGVGHSFADFYFDVPDTSVNPNIINGDIHLHLVQPGSFFYWKSYSPDADFPSGVLAYPFECDGYQLPPEQHDVNFKYTSKK